MNLNTSFDFKDWLMDQLLMLQVQLVATGVPLASLSSVLLNINLLTRRQIILLLLIFDQILVVNVPPQSCSSVLLDIKLLIHRRS